MGMTNEGLNHALDVLCHGSTPVSPWYIGLINETGFTGLSASDTLASHGGWTEDTNYAGDRKEWTEDAASSQSITNSTSVSFEINAETTIKGCFLASVATGTAGTLLCTALFSGGDQAVANGDILKITFTLNASDV